MRAAISSNSSLLRGGGRTINLSVFSPIAAVTFFTADHTHGMHSSVALLSMYVSMRGVDNIAAGYSRNHPLGFFRVVSQCLHARSSLLGLLRRKSTMQDWNRPALKMTLLIGLFFITA